MHTFIFIFIVSIMLFLVHKNNVIACVLFILLPITQTIFFISLGHNIPHSQFFLVKYFLAIIDAILITIARSRRFTKFDKIIKKNMYIFISFNILAANILDFSLGFYINFISGIFVLLSLPFYTKISFSQNTERKYNVYYDIPHTWILAHTLWNLTFIYGVFPVDFMVGAVAALFAPYISALFNKKIFFQTRANALALVIIFLEQFRCITVSSTIQKTFENPSEWQQKNILIFLTAISLVVSVLSFYSIRIKGLIKKNDG